MVRRLFQIDTAIFFSLWLLLMIGGRSAMLRDPGTFWHVATGDRILASGDVSRVDPFSFTRAGHPWVADQWLPECGMAILHRIVGWDGLLAVTAAILAAIYTWLTSRLLRRGLHLLPACLLLAMAILAGAPQFHVRPLIFTIGLTGVTFALLTDVESGRRNRRCLWWLVPMFLLWTNLHGGVLAGLGTVGLCLFGWCGVAVLGGPFAKNSPVQSLRSAAECCGLIAALGLTLWINPHGLDLLRAWWDTLTMPLPNVIKEHAPPCFTEPEGWITLTLAAIYAVAMLGTPWRAIRVTWLMPLVWLLFAIQRVRNVPLFAVMVIVVLPEILPYSRLGRWLTEHDMLNVPKPSIPKQSSKAAKIDNQNRVGFGWVLPLVMVMAALTIQAMGLVVPVVGRGWVRWDTACLPMELLPDLEAINAKSPEGTPIFNDMNFGGFLIDHTPRLRVFVDDRCSLYGGDFLQAYNHARQEDASPFDHWQQIYGFRYALVEANNQFDRHLTLNESWRLVHRTPTATLYELR